ncbi:MAG: hypothetical protein P8L68_17205 [Paracoccaceae bacterium]|nr:hypothetical protein [Paracoccaceae bacterium]MDG1738524.1 hypothetical protein [Paracoccaceae bacterium]MDG2260222.1 hypothetical protein [Paracoccaceae bacterium]
MTRIGFTGTGEIASAMVEGIAGEGHEIRVSQHNAMADHGAPDLLVAALDGLKARLGLTNI